MSQNLGIVASLFLLKSSFWVTQREALSISIHICFLFTCLSALQIFVIQQVFIVYYVAVTCSRCCCKYVFVHLLSWSVENVGVWSEVFRKLSKTEICMRMICPLVASIPSPTFIHILAKPLHVLFKYFKFRMG